MARAVLFLLAMVFFTEESSAKGTKRSDDVTVQALLEQQARAIAQLQAHIASMEAADNAAIQTMTQRIQQLEGQLSVARNQSQAGSELHEFLMAHVISTARYMKDFLESVPHSRESLQAEFPVRLVGGTSSHEGRVELRIGDTWGTICDDEVTDNFAKVICNQLGLPSSAAVQLQQARFGNGTGHVYLDDVHCAGDELHVLLCPSAPLFSGDVDCNHAEDVSVICL